MRVAILLDSGEACPVADPDHYDLRANPQAIEKIVSAQQHPPLRSFLLHVNGSESIFSTFGCKTWTALESGVAEPHIFASRVDMIFLQESANFGVGPHQELAKHLAPLLDRDLGEALNAKLHISPAEFSAENSGFCLRLCIYARGANPKQAEARWGLGLARTQQALLFLARTLRQHSAAEDDG